MPDAAGTCTAVEHAVLEFLKAGPAVLGPATEEFRRRRLLSPAGRFVQAGAETYSATPEQVRTVESRPARALQRAGWVLIDAGGTVTINPGGPAA